MKKKRNSKVISALLAAVMLFLMLPLSVITVTAESSATVDSSSAFNDQASQLGRVYNMLGNAYIEGDGSTRQIFKTTNGITVDFNSNNAGGESKTTFVSSVSDYFSNESQSMNVEVGAGSEASAKIKIKMVELNVSQKFELNMKTSVSSGGSSETHNSTEYMLFECIYRIGTYSMGLDNEEQIRRLWAVDAGGNFTVLDSDFVKSLLKDDPEVFFNTYGTHLITRHTAGGNAYSSYYGEIQSSSYEVDFEHNVSVKNEMSGAIIAKNNFETSHSTGEGSSSENSTQTGTGKVRGGRGFAWDQESSSNWTKTLDRETSVLLLDDNLKMIPIWNLLIDENQIDRRTELEQYFNKTIDRDFAEIYSDYIYSPTASKNFKGYEFITTAEDLIAISDDLDGKYVLLNNIDLGGVEWSPIGTAEKPFTGTLDGNGNTISGLSITKTIDGVAGLFGYNNGTVKDLRVSGNIDADASGSKDNVAYIGGIAGYNGGTINNCYNLVSVNGSIVIADEENIDDYLVNETWFDTHSTDIENAKSATPTTLTDGAVITVGNNPIRLNGSATNVTINVSGATVPAYIVLENASFTGSISNVGDNSREVCIISIGESNNITGVTDTIPVNIPNASLYIFGEADLIVTGGTGSVGTTGVKGSDGKLSLNVQALRMCVDGEVTFCGGNGGRGGNGSAGAPGTTSKDPTNGGNGGRGGNGGNGAYPLNSNANILIFGNTKLYLKNGNGGEAGNGGKGGNGGFNTWQLWCNEASGGDGGAGGNGGNSYGVFSPTEKIIAEGNSRIVIIVGNAGNGGSGGAGGSRGGAAGDIVNSGRNGYKGSAGALGTILCTNGTDTYTGPQAVIITSIKKYEAYDTTEIWETAKTNHSLVSIGSAVEQALIEELLLYGSLENYWIGLVRRSDSGNGFDKYDWNDGSAIQVTGNGSDAIVNRIDANNNILCGAYANFAAGQPDNAGVGEKYVYISSNGKWYDGAADIEFGYITETNIGSSSTNTIDKNAIFAGGLSGYNAGTIENSCNDAKVSIYKAEAENSGISTYAGGISGYNNGTIDMVVNNGTVESFAISGSMSHYADAYAETISTTSANGKVNDYIGIDDLSAIALSANTLYGEHISSSISAGTDATTTIRDYWNNSKLSIDFVGVTEYFINAGFKTSGLDVSFDGKELNNYTVRYNFYNPIISTVTLVYEKGGVNYQRYVPVRVVDRTPEKLEVEKYPKTEFFVDDEFNFDGLILKITYDNGEESLISAKDKKCIVNSPLLNSTGEKTVEVIYMIDEVNSLATSYTVNVSSIEIVSISIKHLPNKTVYDFGEKLVTDGLIVEAIKNDGSKENVDLSACSIKYNFNIAGECVVTVSYNEFETSFVCTVKEFDVSKTPKIVIEESMGIAGSEVKVTVSLENNPGIVSMYLAMQYDSAVLELVDVQDEGLLNGKTFGNAYTSPYLITWDDSTADSNNENNGDLVTFTFRVSDDATAGTKIPITISYSHGDIIDYDLNSVDFLVVNGCVSVTEFMPGDINMDGTVNAVDVAFIRRHLAGWDDYKSVNTSVADVNKDGAVNATDVALIRRYLAGWDNVVLK